VGYFCRAALVSGSEDKTIKVWNLQSGKETRMIAGHTNWVTSLAISLDGQTLVSGSFDKTIKLWNLQTGAESRTLSTPRQKRGTEIMRA